MKIVKWLKKDWFSLVVDIVIISLFWVRVTNFDVETFLLIAYVILSTIRNYDRYNKQNS